MQSNSLVASPFLSQPRELYTLVFSYFFKDIKTLASLRLVSKALKEWVDDFLINPPHTVRILSQLSCKSLTLFSKFYTNTPSYLQQKTELQNGAGFTYKNALAKGNLTPALSAICYTAVTANITFTLLLELVNAIKDKDKNHPLIKYLDALLLLVRASRYTMAPDPHTSKHINLINAIKEKPKGVMVNFSGINLEESILSNLDLSNFNLSHAKLNSADLSGSNLSHTNLSDADLRKADLRGANLRDANLSRANFTGAKLF